MVYLIVALISSDNFNVFPCNPKFNVNQEPMQFWYPILCKNNTSLNFCLIQYFFVRQINYMIIGGETQHISRHTQVFLWGKDMHKEREKKCANFNIWVPR